MRKPLLKVRDVCWELNISRPTLIKRMKSGIIEYTKDGRDYRFNPQHIEELKEGIKWTESINVKGRPIGTCLPELKEKYTQNLQEQLKSRKLKKSVENGQKN
tara:strand:- start:426 stop:731 length:306 start_codon:yes stop_codon:yes gene_type:complete